jgi:hypothetical protein
VRTHILRASVLSLIADSSDSLYSKSSDLDRRQLARDPWNPRNPRGKLKLVIAEKGPGPGPRSDPTSVAKFPNYLNFKFLTVNSIKFG